MKSLASTLCRALSLAALAAGPAHAADIIVSAQDGKFVRVEGIATFAEPAQQDSLVVPTGERIKLAAGPVSIRSMPR